MSKPTRLPVQHPQAPHCPACEGPLPNLNGLQVMLGFADVGDYKVLGMTLHIQCKCGAKWDLVKEAKH